MKGEMDALGVSLIVRTVSVDIKQHLKFGLSPLRSCVKAEMDVLGVSLIVRTVSVDIKQHLKFGLSPLRSCVKGEMDVLGSPSLIILINGLCGRKAISHSSGAV